MLILRRVLVGGAAVVVTALLIGIPTGVIETSWYHRMTPVLWWNYPVWALSSILTGALVATYVRDPAVPVPATQGGKTFLGSTLSLFAVGCPICNKLVVMAIGVTGALTGSRRSSRCSLSARSRCSGMPCGLVDVRRSRAESLWSPVSRNRSGWGRKMLGLAPG